MRTTLAGNDPLEEDPGNADRSLVDHSDTGLGPIPPPPASADSLVASVVGVDKRFGPVQALTGLHIEIPRSKITVLLGPNGAGKTTAIRMITGAMVPDSGSVTVFGADPTGNAGEEIRRRCGIVSAKPSLYDRLSGLDNLRYAAELYDLGRGKGIDGRIRQAAAQFGIEHALELRVGGYSTGMKTRLALARSILHEPDLLLLDEPTSGLDPESAVAVLQMVRDMTDDGRTVLMCTHLLLEAEGLADEIVVIQDGTSLMWGDPNELSRRYWPRSEVEITTDPAALETARNHPEVLDALATETGIRLVLTSGDAVTAVVHHLSAAGVPLRAVVPYKPSLEDLYFAIRREYQIDHGEPTNEPVWEKIREDAAQRATPAANQPLAEADKTLQPITSNTAPVAESPHETVSETGAAR